MSSSVRIEHYHPGLELPDRFIVGDRHLRDGWLVGDITPPVGFEEAPPGLGTILQQDAKYFYRHDARNYYPFPPQSFRWIHSEHFIEHIEFHDAARWLAQMRRLLKPGGIIRITTPDLGRYMDGYVSDGTFLEKQYDHVMRSFPQPMLEQRHHFARRALMVNQIFYFWGHRWIYDFDELAYLGCLAGFDRSCIHRCSFGCGREQELAALDYQSRHLETLYVELYT